MYRIVVILGQALLLSVSTSSLLVSAQTHAYDHDCMHVGGRVRRSGVPK